jgi:hypothetical protein
MKKLLIFILLLISTNAYASKVTLMPELIVLSPTDLLLTVHGGTDSKITWNNFLNNFQNYTLGGGINRLGKFTAPIVTDPYTLTAPNCYASILFYGATGVINLPTASAGMNVVVYNTGSFTITINPQNADVIVLLGTPLSAGVSIILGSGVGNYVSLVSDDAGHWVSIGTNGTISQGT